eukprot:29565_1
MVTDRGHVIIVWVLLICFRCNCSDVLQCEDDDCKYSNDDKFTEISVAFNDDMVLIRKDKLTFETTFSNLFNSNMIEHELKLNSKIPEILKNQTEFKHYETEEALFIIYDFNVFDMKITLRVPLNLFEIDLEEATETEQLQYYKNKALKLEEVIKSNDLVLVEYEMAQFNSNNDRGGELQLLNDSRIWYPTEDSTVVSIRDKKVTYLNHKTIKENLYFRLSLKQNTLILNTSLVWSVNILKRFENRGDDQHLLNAFSRDIEIGMLKNYDLLNAYESKEIVIIYFLFSSRDKGYHPYGCNNFYRFHIASNGKVILKYIYTVEYQKDKNEKSVSLRKTNDPQITHISRSQKSYAYYHTICKSAIYSSLNYWCRGNPSYLQVHCQDVTQCKCQEKSGSGSFFEFLGFASELYPLYDKKP